MKKIVRLYMPEYGKLMNENKKSYRNQSNIWIIDSIKDVNNRKKFDKTNKNNVLFFNLLIFVINSYHIGIFAAV